MSLFTKNVLITGGARRLGRILALAIARRGAGVVIHHGHSPTEAQALQAEIGALGGKSWILQADLEDPQQAAGLMARAGEFGPLAALVNNAAIFQALDWNSTDLAAWDRHLKTNLTAPFLLCQAFARSLAPNGDGSIVNMLDWRAMRPGADHLPYTISKAALAALTQSLAIALAPHIRVNGLGLGAILPPGDTTAAEAAASNIVQHVPAGRWADPDEVAEALIFLLDGPKYITGEIVHLDGGRHLI